MARVVIHSGWEDNLKRDTEEHLLKPICDAIADDANHYAPVRTGRLSHSYHVIDGDDKLTKYVGSNVKYAPIVELGSRPHVIEVHNASVLTDHNGHFFGRLVHHPGTHPQPHLRPAVYKRRSV